MDGPCESVKWNPIDSAVTHSALAGVIAGLVFGGIVVLLGRRSSNRRPAQAIGLFIASFLAFALDSFLFGVIAGERICSRAWTEMMLAAGLLGIAALGLFTGLAWLLYAHSEADTFPFRITATAVYCLAGVVALHLAVTSHDYLRDVRGKGYPEWMNAILIVFVVAFVLVVFVHLIYRSTLARWADKVVETAAYATIAYATVCAIAFGTTASFADEWADSVPAPVAIGAVLLSLVLCGFSVVVQLAALPGPATPTPASGTTGTSP